MDKLHSLCFNNLMHAENALVVVRTHIQSYAGLFTPVGTEFAHSVVFETEGELPEETQTMLQERTQPNAVTFNRDIVRA